MTGSPRSNLGYTPVEGTRLSLFLRAADSLFRLQYAWRSRPFDNLQLQRSDDVVAGTHRRHRRSCSMACLESGVFVGQLQDDRSTSSHWRRPIPTRRRRTRGTIPTGRMCNGTTRCIWTICCRTGPVRQRNDFRLRIYRRHGQGAGQRELSRAFALRPVRRGLDDRQCDLCRVADNDRCSVWQLPDSCGRTGSMDDSPTTWRLGGVYDLKEIATHFKFAYGTAFRAPSLFDRYGNMSAIMVAPSPDMSEIRIVEAGTIQGLGDRLHHRHSRLRPARPGPSPATYFDQRVTRPDR